MTKAYMLLAPWINKALLPFGLILMATWEGDDYPERVVSLGIQRFGRLS